MEIAVFAVLLLVLALSGAQSTVPTNSKFLDPNRSEEDNIKVAAPEQDSRTLHGTINKESSKDVMKMSGHKKFVFSNLVHPVLSFTGLSNGGLYGAQYYGLAKPATTSSWKVPFFNYPFYNYKHPWAQKIKPKIDGVQ